MLQDKIKQYTEEINQFNPSNATDVENFRLKFLVSKGIVKSLFEEFKTVSPEEKRILGKVLNELKQLAEKRLQEAQATLEAYPKCTPRAEGDLTLPGVSVNMVSRHHLSLVCTAYSDICKKF